jgi:hypothetical protein
MNKKNNKKNGRVAAKPVARAVTAVRNTAIPKKTRAAQAVAAAKSPTYEEIALKAYFISISPECGSETDNWLRAERELRGL